MTHMLQEPTGTNTLNDKGRSADVDEKVECPSEDEERKSLRKRKLVLLLKALFRTHRLQMEERLKENDHVPIKVISGLYIGSIGGAKSKESLKDVGITHVLSCAAIIPPQFPEDFEYLHLTLEDKAAQKIDDMFKRGIPFIVHALKNGGKVFVHCFAGKSRATTMCCAYLIHSMRIPFSKALEIVKEVRPIVDPNIGFRHELVKFAKSLGIPDPSIEIPQPVQSIAEGET